MNETIEDQEQEQFDEQEYRTARFPDLREVCKDAEWRFGSTCACHGENLTYVHVQCTRPDTTSVSVEQTVVDGFATSQKFCDEFLCVIERLNHTVTGLSARYSLCHAFESAGAGQGREGLNGSGDSDKRRVFNCQRRPHICNVTASGDLTVESNFGFVIEDGNETNSLLCFENETTPVFLHGIPKESSYADDIAAEGGEKPATTMLYIGLFVFVTFMVLTFLGLWNQRSKESNSRNRTIMGRESSYIDVAMQEDDMEENGNINVSTTEFNNDEVETVAATAVGTVEQNFDIELTIDRRNQTSSPLSHGSHEHEDRSHSKIPVAYAQSIQRCFESGEFSDSTDDSAEWSG